MHSLPARTHILAQGARRLELVSENQRRVYGYNMSEVEKFEAEIDALIHETTSKKLHTREVETIYIYIYICICNIYRHIHERFLSPPYRFPLTSK